MIDNIPGRIKRKTSKELCLTIIVILVIEVLSCVPFIMIFGKDSPVYVWFMYCFPVYRLGDFFVGCCIAKWYFGEEKIGCQSLNRKMASVLEILSLVVTVLLCMWYKMNTNNFFMDSIHNKTTIYIPIAAAWIILFSENKGVITRILSNDLTIYIGNIAAYLFLIHYVITVWTNSGMQFVSYEPHGVVKYSIILAEFIVSVVLAIVYKSVKESRSIRIAQ